MIARWFIALAALSISTPAHAEPAIRGLFVGIDKYLYSRTHDQFANFSDLQGAVADTRAFKSALQVAYGLDLDSPEEGSCYSWNSISVTLTNACATREAILAAFAGQIEASAPGDTLIFYFAGHGGQIDDDEYLDQPTGFNSTLLPVDARAPGDAEVRDILDRQIRMVIDVANARGVNVVTIFDSCNSGTGSRRLTPGSIAPNGAARGVSKVLDRQPLPWSPNLSAEGPGGGYRVHFGAARDDEAAREVGNGGSVNGVFTTALVQELIANPDRTFGDLATAVRLKVGQAGYNSQTPQAEGDLQRSLLGGNTRSVALFEAARDGDSVVLSAGSLLGMTEGSKFALFDSETAALAESPQPLARATISEVDVGRAILRIDERARASLPSRLIALETEHAVGDFRLEVAVEECEPGGQSLLTAAVQEMPLARLAPERGSGVFTLARDACSDQAIIRLWNDGGSLLSYLGPLDDPLFPERLRRALVPIYNARRLLSLPSITAEAAGIDVCLWDEIENAKHDCPEPVDGLRTVTENTKLILTLNNNREQERFFNVLAIDNQFGIGQIVPQNLGVDPPLAPYSTNKWFDFGFKPSGLVRLAIFITDARINTAVLKQDPVPHDLVAACATDDCYGGNGSRGAGAGELGEWNIVLVDIDVAPREGEEEQDP